MKLKSRDLVFAAIVIVSVGGLYYLSTRAKVPPAMPVNQAHTAASTREQCLVCHTPEKLEALQQAHKHPSKWRDAKVNCLQCHKPPQANAKLNSKLNEQSQTAQAQFGEVEDLYLWLKQKRK
ncbi:MAG TPA: NapC/NirT family cytochrome c [Blastocatellia bacterium]|nr:NapC/NirT family cytochrome c [Blastocatellia bacterium]